MLMSMLMSQCEPALSLFTSVVTGSLKSLVCGYISFRVLNYEQQTAKGIVLEGHNTFITGKAGTGKTF